MTSNSKIVSLAKDIEPEVVELILQRKYFYGHLLQQFRRHMVDENYTGVGQIIRTLAVNVTNDLQPNLFINVHFYNSGDYDANNPQAQTWGLTQEEKLAVLEHEILHILNKHFLRADNRNHYVWNLANDLAINQYIHGLPSGMMCHKCNIFIRKRGGVAPRVCPVCGEAIDPDTNVFETLDINNFKVDGKKIELPPERPSEVYYDILWEKIPKFIIQIGTKLTDQKEKAAKERSQQGEQGDGQQQQGQQGQGKQNQPGQGQGKGQQGQGQGQGGQSGQQDGQSGSESQNGQGQGGGGQQGQQGGQSGKGQSGGGGGSPSSSGQSGNGQSGSGPSGRENQPQPGKAGQGNKGQYNQNPNAPDGSQGQGQGQGQQPGQPTESPQTGSGICVKVEGVKIPMPMDNHEAWAAGSDDREMSHEKVKDMVRKAMHKVSEKSQGYLPAWMKGLIDEVLTHKTLKWKSELRKFVGYKEFAGLITTRKRLNRRFTLMPGYIIQRKAHFVVACDSSGSIDDKEFAQFFREVDMMFAAKITITLVECDADITNVEEYRRRPKRPEGIKRYGYGGTDFRPVFKFVEGKKIWRNANKEQFKIKGKVDGIIYLTDGCGTFPDKIPCPTIWVFSTPQYQNYGWKPELGKALVMERD